MKLTGIIEDVFNGVTIFRGYASLRNLAILSIKGNYQREHDKHRLEDIKTYMSLSPFVFFPELIFGWQLEDYEIIKQIKEDENANNIITSNNIKFKKNKFKFKPILEIEGPKTKVLSIDIPDTINEPIFSRIDGNHRLSVIDSLIENDEENSLLHTIVPYSIIIQNKNNESDKYEAAYFYLINSKAKPLTINENLRAIIETGTFSNSEKEGLLSIETSQIDLLEGIIQQLKAQGIDFIKDQFQNEIYSFALTLTTNLVTHVNSTIEQTLSNIINAIKYVNCIYVKNEIRLPNQDIILAMVIHKYNGTTPFTNFLEWINKNEMGNIDNLTFDNILKIYNNLHKQRSYKVFVAMPYISFKRVNEYNKLFSEILSEISKKIGFNLELIPIMRFRGASQRIDKRLIEKIKECDIFIGDLTTCNNNVIFEVGLAEGNDKEILLIKAEEDTSKIPFDEATKLDKGKIIPFDMDKLQYIPYSNSGYYNDIKSIMRINIPEIIKKISHKKS